MKKKTVILGTAMVVRNASVNGKQILKEGESNIDLTLLSQRQLIVWALTTGKQQLFKAILKSVNGRPHLLHRNNNYLYFPGTNKPKDRILMIAHIDTVRRTQLLRSDLSIDGNIFTSRTDCLGADDRAGVAALIWMMMKNGDGHSYLFTDLEECGGIGADAAVSDLKNELSLHAYAIEPDRYGDGQAVFYDGTDNDEFEDYLGEIVPEFRFSWGTYTDIATICPEIGICGVNVSIGYINQHTSYETLFYDAWLRGIDTIDRLLNCSDIPKFVPNKAIMPTYGHYWRDPQEWLGNSNKNIEIGKWDKLYDIEEVHDHSADKDGDFWHIYDEGMVPIVNEAGDIVDYMDWDKIDGRGWTLVDEHGALSEKNAELLR